MSKNCDSSTIGAHSTVLRVDSDPCQIDNVDSTHVDFAHDDSFSEFLTEWNTLIKLTKGVGTLYGQSKRKMSY